MSFCKSDQKKHAGSGILTCNGSGMFCRPKLGYIGALDTRLISRLQHGGVRKGVQVGTEPRWGPGWPEWVCMYAQSWNGGNRVWWVPRGNPTIGKLELLGLISGEMVLQDGWQGQMDTSKCGNAARFGTCMGAHARSAGGRWEVVVGT